jgi:hypothetical protein
MMNKKIVTRMEMDLVTGQTAVIELDNKFIISTNMNGFDLMTKIIKEAPEDTETYDVVLMFQAIGDFQKHIQRRDGGFDNYKHDEAVKYVVNNFKEFKSNWPNNLSELIETSYRDK